MKIIQNKFIMLIYRFTLAFLLLFPANATNGQDRSAERDELRAVAEKWILAKEQMTGLRMKGFSYFAKIPGNEEVTVEVILQVVERLEDQVLGDNCSLAVLTGITNDEIGESKEIKQWWRQIEFLQDGENIRVDEQSHPGSNLTVLRTATGETLYAEGERRVTLAPQASQLSVETLESFIVPAPFPASLNGNWSITDYGDGYRKLTTSNFFRIFDPATGFVHQAQFQHKGRDFAGHIQRLPIHLSSNVVMPLILAEILYHRDPGHASKANVLRIYVAKEWELNPKVSENDFKVEVPAKTVVVNKHEPKAK